MTSFSNQPMMTEGENIEIADDGDISKSVNMNVLVRQHSLSNLSILKGFVTSSAYWRPVGRGGI
jgi:hypothetical protein